LLRLSVAAGGLVSDNGGRVERCNRPTAGRAVRHDNAPFGRRLSRAIACGGSCAIGALPIIEPMTETTAGVDAARAGLHYANHRDPGIRREGPRRAFRYRRPTGRLVRDAATLTRIQRLAIPPAWTDVWICADPSGHLQAVGRDARGRLQYRYHPAFRSRRDARKFDRLIRFGERLPRIRRQVARDLRAPGLPREKVLAAMVRLLELTRMRVGNDEYARLNRSFGLSTLRNRHAEVRGARVRFRFRGKSGRAQEVRVVDRRLAAVIRRTQDLPGQHLFEYAEDDGPVERIDSDAVNAYLREAADDPSVSAKDFRTWAGTVLAFRALEAAGEPGDAAEARQNVVEAVDAAAAVLGNTRAVARASYIHPAVVEAYGKPANRGRGRGRAAEPAPGPALPADAAAPPTVAEERRVLAILRSRRGRG